MGAKRILLVDDEVDLLETIGMRLASWGYDVVSAKGGKEATRLLKEHLPDAVILDIVMPEIDGIETLKRIRSINNSIPVLMLTAYGDEEKFFSEAKKLGISGFVHKGSEFIKASDAIRVILKGTKYK